MILIDIIMIINLGERMDGDDDDDSCDYYYVFSNDYDVSCDYFYFFLVIMYVTIVFCSFCRY